MSGPVWPDVITGQDISPLSSLSGRSPGPPGPPGPPTCGRQEAEGDKYLLTLYFHPARA